MACGLHYSTVTLYGLWFTPQYCSPVWPGLHYSTVILYRLGLHYSTVTLYGPVYTTVLLPCMACGLKSIVNLQKQMISLNFAHFLNMCSWSQSQTVQNASVSNSHSDSHVKWPFNWLKYHPWYILGIKMLNIWRKGLFFFPANYQEVWKDRQSGQGALYSWAGLDWQLFETPDVNLGCSPAVKSALANQVVHKSAQTLK